MDNLFLKYLNYQILKKHTNNHFLNFNELFEQCYVVGTLSKAKYSNQVINILNTINVKNIQNIHGHIPQINNKFLLKGELSYFEAWIKILKNTNSKILIFDDDIRLMYNFQMNFSKLFQNVPHDWDIVYLGASQHNWEDIDTKEAYTKGYYRAHNTKGSFAMLLSNNAINAILKNANIHNTRNPLDEVINNLDLNKYVLFPNVVIADVSLSQIRKSRKNIVDHSNKMKWNIFDYDYFRHFKINAIITDTKILNQSYVNTVKIENKKKENPKKFLKNACNVYDTNFVYKNLDDDISYYYIEEHIKMMVCNNLHL
jgi:GR25 family glycosyltransferase involved in LPS biosynthesis